MLKNAGTLEGIRIICTYACKRKCQFCYQKVREGGFLDNDKFKNIIENLTWYPIYLTFQGGEVSYFPDKTIKLIETSHKILPQVFRKSVTSNGDGDFDFYNDLKLVGITHLSFSLHNTNSCNDKLMEKMLRLSHSGFYTVRVNCYFDEENLENVKNVILFCKENDIQLTLCEDLRCENSVDYYSPNILKQILPDYKYDISFYKHEYIVNFDHWQLWIYRHLNHYDYNNLIILPDGSTTDTFDDVQECKGNILED